MALALSTQKCFLSFAFQHQNIAAASLRKTFHSSRSIISGLEHKLFLRQQKQQEGRRSISSSSTIMATTTNNNKNLFWNREESAPFDNTKNTAVLKPAKILSLSNAQDPANAALHKGPLPDGAELLGIGATMDDFDIAGLQKQEPNVLFVSHPQARESLEELLKALPTIQWIHARSAGIDFIASDTLGSSCEGKVMTNAKGTFSSTLAEYTLMACSYFAKDLPRLLKQKQDANWEKYPILELRGATLGVIGYGDIGRAASKLAKAYGMKVIALRRRPEMAQHDPICDKVYGNDKDSLNALFQESDYVLCAAPLTKETTNMIGEEQFSHAKPGAVFVNVGRGPIVDENALIQALKDGKLKGAGLDVTAIEPLPKDSELWKLDNVLLSPHNMDMTATFMHEATEFFVKENLPRFLAGEDVLNPVNPAAGY